MALVSRLWIISACFVVWLVINHGDYVDTDLDDVPGENDSADTEHIDPDKVDMEHGRQGQGRWEGQGR